MKFIEDEGRNVVVGASGRDTLRSERKFKAKHIGPRRSQAAVAHEDHGSDEKTN